MRQGRKSKNSKKEKKEVLDKKKMGPTPEKAKNTWQDPEIRARRIQAIKEAWADPEKRKNRLEKMKRTTMDGSDLISKKQEKNL